MLPSFPPILSEYTKGPLQNSYRTLVPPLGLNYPWVGSVSTGPQAAIPLVMVWKDWAGIASTSPSGKVRSLPFSPRWYTECQRKGCHGTGRLDGKVQCLIKGIFSFLNNAHFLTDFAPTLAVTIDGP